MAGLVRERGCLVRICQKIHGTLKQQRKHILNFPLGAYHIGEAPAFVGFSVKSLEDWKDGIHLSGSQTAGGVCLFCGGGHLLNLSAQRGRQEQEALFGSSKMVIFSILKRTEEQYDGQNRQTVGQRPHLHGQSIPSDRPQLKKDKAHGIRKISQRIKLRGLEKNQQKGNGQVEKNAERNAEGGKKAEKSHQKLRPHKNDQLPDC